MFAPSRRGPLGPGVGRPRPTRFPSEVRPESQPGAGESAWAGIITSRPPGAASDNTWKRRLSGRDQPNAAQNRGGAAVRKREDTHPQWRRQQIRAFSP